MTGDTKPKPPLSELNDTAAEEETKFKAIRIAAGRYTLTEAARAIAAATGEREQHLLEALKHAAAAHELPMYEPGRQQVYRYGAGGASRVRDFYEEAYWYDLNQWLKSHEPRLARNFQFPEPNQEGSGVPKPKKQGVHQEDEILRVITELGFKPAALPKSTAKNGVKAQVRAKLSFSTKVFDKAWDRLRAQKSIVDAKV
jgi:hypothetical protein